MDKEKIIKEALRKYQEQKIPIEAWWDAGGDSCACRVTIGQEMNVAYKGVNLCPQLVDQVIAILELPHTGERYHIGSGIIDINAQDEIFITYSSRYHHDTEGVYHYSYYDLLENNRRDDWEDEIEKLGVLSYKIPLDDPLNLHKLLHKAEVLFLGRMDLDLKTENHLIIRILQGDEYSNPEEGLSPYFQLVNNELLNKLFEMKKLEDNLPKNPTYTPFKAIIFKGVLLPSQELNVEILPSSEIFQSYTHETVILFE